MYEMLLNCLRRDMLNQFTLIEVCSVDILFVWKSLRQLAQLLQGISSERRIYEKHFDRRDKIAFIISLQTLTYQALFLQAPRPATGVFRARSVPGVSPKTGVSEA